MRIRTIVVGTDLGESGARALSLALPTAKATKAALWLVHGNEIGLDSSWPDLPVGVKTAAFALRKRLQGRLENSLETLESERKICEAEGVICHTSCEEGQPWETILRTATSVSADLIVVGDHSGSVSLQKRLLGSTAERVVSQAPCSVLVACGRLRNDYEGARIVVGVDFSAHGVESVRWARRLARVVQGQIVLAHTIVPPTRLGALPTEWPGVRDGLVSSADSRLRQLILTEGLPESTEVSITHGNPGNQLCETVAVNDADLLFVGTRGKSRLRGMMLGSVSQYCLRNSPVPVLTVRP